jgi:hypothetical protein
MHYCSDTMALAMLMKGYPTTRNRYHPYITEYLQINPSSISIRQLFSPLLDNRAGYLHNSKIYSAALVLTTDNVLFTILYVNFISSLSFVLLNFL